MRSLWIVAFLLLAGAARTPAHTLRAQTLRAQTSGPWIFEKSGTTAGLRGIHAVGGGVAWASGTNGTVLRTENGGKTWQSCAVPPGAEKLDFRGVQARDSRTALVMASGPGDQSRLYQTTDGCSSWKLLFTNPDPQGFWDAVVFASRTDGWLLGDPVRGRFVLFTTRDGGATWQRTESPGLEAAVPGPADSATGAFAASNSSLLAVSGRLIFGTGGAFLYREKVDIAGRSAGQTGPVFRISRRWNRQTLPLAQGGDAAGIFSLGWRRGGPLRDTLVAVGGDYSKPQDTTGTAAWSGDGGRTWTAAEKPPHGYRSAVAWDAAARAWIAAGTNGSDISYDDGRTWHSLDDGSWNALSLPWIVGPHGRIARIDPGRLDSARRPRSPASPAAGNLTKHLAGDLTGNPGSKPVR